LATYGPAELVRAAQIAENYRLDQAGRLDDEAMRCRTGGFRSRLPGTPVFAWVRARQGVEPPVVELCELCSAAASRGPESPTPRLLKRRIF
jgi:hypothetical protein